MRISLWNSVFAVVLLPLASHLAHAERLDGTIIETSSQWGYDGTAIVTKSVLEDAQGGRRTIHQLGGSVDGVGMRVSHSPMLMRSGDKVVIEAHRGKTVEGRSALSLRHILNMDRPAPEGGDKAAPNSDFVLTRNAAGANVHWRSGCAFVAAAGEGSTQIEGSKEFTVIENVLAAWENGSRSCSNFEIRYEGLDAREVGLDGINIIKFRDSTWCRPATSDDPQQCYDEAAAGLTTLFFVDDSSSSRNGEILDADIELNGVQFAFATDGDTNGLQACEADLANTLTHEVGHFLGIDHTCWVEGPRLEDDQGNIAPSCSNRVLSSAITDATMYNFQSCGETKKATLESDDIEAMCGIYPIESDPASCERAEVGPAGCCAIASTGSSDEERSWPGIALLLLLGLVVVNGTRRRA